MHLTTSFLILIMPHILWAGPHQEQIVQPNQKNEQTPDKVSVLIKSAPDGSVLDVNFQTLVGGSMIRTRSGLINYYTERLAGQPDVYVDWKKIVTSGLTNLRKKQNLSEKSKITVIPDNKVNFGAVLEVVACCRNAGFRDIEFGDHDSGKFIFQVDAKGEITCNGTNLKVNEVKQFLAKKIPPKGKAAQQINILIQVHPQARYGSVYPLFQELRSSGFRNITTTAQTNLDGKSKK